MDGWKTSVGADEAQVPINTSTRLPSPSHTLPSHAALARRNGGIQRRCKRQSKVQLLHLRKRSNLHMSSINHARSMGAASLCNHLCSLFSTRMHVAWGRDVTAPIHALSARNEEISKEQSEWTWPRSACNSVVKGLRNQRFRR